MNAVRVQRVIRKIASLLDNWHWVLLLAAAPFLLFPTPSRSLALLIVPAVWLIAWLAGREPLPRTPLNLSLLVMFVMVLVSLWATYDLVFSLPNLCNMVLGVGLYYVFAREGRHPTGWWIGLGVFVVAGVAVAALGLVSARWIDKVSILTAITSRLPRMLTNLSSEGGLHPNTVAGALLWGIPILGLLCFFTLTRFNALRKAYGSRRTWVGAILIAGIALFLLGVFILTQSRGGYIGLAVGIAAIFFAGLSPRWRRRFIVILLCAAVLGGILLVQFGSVASLAERVLGESAGSEAVFSPDTFEGRLEIWSRAIYAIQDFPFTGMGMNTFRQVVPVLYPLFLIGPDYDIGSAHNEFLQAAVDLGLPGLIAFVSIYLGALWMLSQIAGEIRRSDSGLSSEQVFLSRLVVLGLGTGMLAYIVFSLTGAIALGWRYGIFFWMSLGLIAGLFEQARTGKLAQWTAWFVSEPSDKLAISTAAPNRLADGLVRVNSDVRYD